MIQTSYRYRRRFPRSARQSHGVCLLLVAGDVDTYPRCIKAHSEYFACMFFQGEMYNVLYNNLTEYFRGLSVSGGVYLRRHPNYLRGSVENRSL